MQTLLISNCYHFAFAGIHSSQDNVYDVIDPFFAKISRNWILDGRNVGLGLRGLVPLFPTFWQRGWWWVRILIRNLSDTLVQITQPSPIFRVPIPFPRHCFANRIMGINSIRYSNIAIVSRSARFLSAHPSSSLSHWKRERGKYCYPKKRRKKFVESQFWNCFFCLFEYAFYGVRGKTDDVFPVRRAITVCQAGYEIESKICFSNKRSVEPASKDGELRVFLPVLFFFSRNSVSYTVLYIRNYLLLSFKA